MKTIEEIWSIVNGLKELYPDGVCSLDYRKDYELLFSVRLAAQCTDERVNKVTPALYARFPTLEALAEADIAEVERYIHSTGFFRAKAKDIVLASQMLLRDYGGRVPDTMEELIRLAPKNDVLYLGGDISPEELEAMGAAGGDYNHGVYLRNPSWLAYMKEHKMVSNVWTVNHPVDMIWAIEQQIDFLTTDRPDLFLELVR